MSAEEVIQKIREFLRWQAEEEDNAPHVFVEISDILEILDQYDGNSKRSS
jgi:hypothetical protein